MGDWIMIKLNVRDLKGSRDAGVPMTVIDVRSFELCEDSDAEISGAWRIPPENFRVDPSWPKEQLTVVY